MRSALPLLTAVLLLVLAGPVRAQPGQGCQWVAPTGQLNRQTLGQSVITRVQNPHLVCRDGVRIEADSARFFETSEFYQLFGDVTYEDAERTLTGDLVRYWRAQGRLESRGNSRLVRKSDGAVITGEDLDYLEAGAGRDQDQLVVEGGRPHAVFYRRPAPARPAADSVGPPLPTEPADTAAVPYEIDADVLRIFGDQRLIATGAVEVHQDSLDAFAQSLEYTQDPDPGTPDRLFLRQDARMVTPGYELVGDSIDARLLGDAIDNLSAVGHAVLTGEELRLAAPRLRMFLADGALEELVAYRERSETPRELMVGLDSISQAQARERAAREAAEAAEAGEVAGEEGDTVPIFEMEHPPRPVARAEGFLMVADSLRVQAPGQALERLIAVGNARGESTARDSLNTADTPEIARRDWIEGDTIVASFARVAAPDRAAGTAEGTSGADYELERLVATADARSLYRLEAEDSASAGPPDPDADPGGTADAGDADTGDRVGGGDAAGAADSVAVVAGTAAAPDSLAAGAAADARSRAAPPRMALHYVTGQQITIILENGQVARMEVVGPTQGFHLEPDATLTRGGGAGGRGGGGAGAGGSTPRPFDGGRR